MTNNLDLRGQVCPMTTVKLKRHIKALPPNSAFLVMADDEEARVDFPAAIKTLKCEYVGIEERDGYQVYAIRKP